MLHPGWGSKNPQTKPRARARARVRARVRASSRPPRPPPRKRPLGRGLPWMSRAPDSIWGGPCGGLGASQTGTSQPNPGRGLPGRGRHQAQPPRQGPFRQGLPGRGLPRGLPGRGPSTGLPGRGLPGRASQAGPGRGLPDQAGTCRQEVAMFYWKVWGISFSGDLTGFSPATCRVHRAARSCLRDWSSVARRRASGSGATSPAGFGAFALLDGPGLTGFRV